MAFKTQRLRAARAGAIGLEITTLPQLAARLGGGFLRPVTPDILQPAIRAALDAGGFADLEGVRRLPGMVRAVQRTLTQVWSADVTLEAELGPRLADMAQLDDRVRKALPPGVLAPPDLCSAALAHLRHARRLFGPIELAGLLDVDPVWRPLVAGLARETLVTWTAPLPLEADWFPGELSPPPPSPSVQPSAVICADPHAEVVEALRWARGLMAKGVPAAEIAVAAIAPGTWDEPMLVLSRSGQLPVHFTHGVAALESGDGQACAALADILLRGLSQSRVRRLLRRSRRAREGLPDDWSRGLPRAVGLFTEPQWRAALVAARQKRESGALAEQVMADRLALLAHGPAGAELVGERLLDPAALDLWREALRAAPAEALDLSLADIRTPDPTELGAAISWGPAAHLAASPRPFVRLLGLTARAWPRPVIEDPLLPDHVLARRILAPVPRPEQDVRLFEAIRAGATAALVLSRSRRSSEGSLLAPSRLFLAQAAQVLERVRTPDHAFSEADRLLARPKEALAHPRLALGRTCWRAWASPVSTAFDGDLPPNDPVVAAALAREQSATSLRRLLRDPLGFIWRYALGWRPSESRSDVLSLDPAEFGELVHQLIQRTVSGLEPQPGLNRASQFELETAMAAAADEVRQAWPGQRPAPPALLWRRTVDEAARLALAGLLLDEQLQPGTRSWSEAPFGEAVAGAPWEADVPVILGGLRIGGVIDRLDLRGDRAAARVTDYKSGAPPQNIAAVRLAGGAELQRVVYAAAVRQRLPDVRQAVSRLVYLRGGPAAHPLAGDALDAAMADADVFIEAAATLVAGGAAPPGPDADSPYNEMRLALPAELDAYLRRKSRVLATAAGALPELWGRP